MEAARQGLPITHSIHKRLDSPTPLPKACGTKEIGEASPIFVSLVK